MNIDPKSTKKAEMSCGHCYSSEGITELLEYCVISDHAEIKCPAIASSDYQRHKKCDKSFDYN